MSSIARIMVVEDNVANLKLVGDLLEIEGFDVSRCPDAKALFWSWTNSALSLF